MDGYDDCSLIDPYNLLGVTINSSPKEVKQAYYNLALLCHPDKSNTPLPPNLPGHIPSASGTWQVHWLGQMALH